MSGSGGHKKKATRSQGWEEAGSEFYQENYSVDADSVEYLHKDPKHIATLLPSKQSRTAATMKNGKNGTNFKTMRKTSTRSRRDSTIYGRGASTTIGGDVSISMLPDLSQNLSNEETTWEEIMEIKAMPVPMAQKKEYKDKILTQPNLRLQGYEQFKWKRRKAWRQFKTRLNETYEKMKLWRRDLKHIEGYFGTGVLAYFLLIKWLFYLNLFIFTLIFLFVTLPTILLVKESDYSCANNTADCCTEKYFNTSYDSNNVFLDLVQGTGTLEQTALFYGYYPNKTFEYVLNDDGQVIYYNLPLAYISVCLVYFVISLYAIVRSAATGIKQRLIESEGQFYQYCNIVFGGWDYCLHNMKSVKIKQKAIFNELKVLLESGKLEEERRSRNRNEYCKIVIKRYLVHFICSCILILCSAAIYFVFDYSTKSLKSFVYNEEFTAKLTQLFYEFLPSISIVCLNVLVPLLFKFFLRFENYSPVYAIKITLIRTVLLRIFSLFVLYASLKNKITCEEETDKKNDAICLNSNCSNVPICWETYVGQQIYKLLLTDFAIHFFLTFFVNSIRAVLARNFQHSFCQFIGEQTFDLPKNVLDIVYIQTLCWFGYFYAPLLSALASVAFFLLFYIKKFACLHNSKPSAIIYRASRSKSIFMLMLLVCFVFAVLPIAYSIFEIVPSKSCGPFHDLPAVWDLVIATLMETPDWIRNIGFFISTAGFVIPVFIILLLLLYYYSAVNSANRHMVTVLKNQLVLEGHDKQFLLDRLSLFIKQENQKRQRYAENMREGDRNISST